MDASGTQKNLLTADFRGRKIQLLQSIPEREMQIDKKGTASFLKKVCRLKLKNTSHVRIDGVLCAVFGRNKNY